MNVTDYTPVVERFIAIIDMLIRDLEEQFGGGRHPWMAAPVLLLARKSLRGIAAGVAALVARLAAGTLPPPAPARRAAPRPKTRSPARPDRFRTLKSWLPAWLGGPQPPLPRAPRQQDKVQPHTQPAAPAPHRDRAPTQSPPALRQPVSSPAAPDRIELPVQVHRISPIHWSLPATRAFVPPPPAPKNSQKIPLETPSPHA